MRACLLAGTAACAVLLTGSAAVAQSALSGFTQGASGTAGAPAADTQLFLEADTVTYDSDKSVVTASGGVKVDYGPYKLVARDIVYDQKTRRLVARGDVELAQPDGNRVYADSIDITDTFRDGFVKALRIETPDNTRFAAAVATRREGAVTTFEQGVYTACEPCRENPDRAPLWQVKARKIVWDQNAKEVRYYDAQFEFFGAPIAYLPYFQSPDPTVKRKSGFLAPSFRSSSELGYGLRVPYFFALADDKDVTVAGTYYTKQGFLAEAEYRQATTDGFFTLQTAGIFQQDKDAFSGDNILNADGSILQESPDFTDGRGMVGTTGLFALSDRWTFGWDVLLQSDQDFARTYGIENFDETLHTSEIFLTGLGDRSYFDLRAQKFDFQSIDKQQQDEQPYVLPSLDYQRIETDGPLGGEVQLDVNVASIRRDTADVTDGVCITDFTDGANCAAPVDGRAFSDELFINKGLEGSYSRASTNLEWRDRYITEAGLVLNPMLGLRGDLYTAEMSSGGFANYGVASGNVVVPAGIAALPAAQQGAALADFYTTGDVSIDESGGRGMATAAMEVRYPYLIQTATGSHIVEPIAQVIARPNETRIGLLPNEDAQTIVFNANNLFALDKFSGYDRIEGGSRANLGLRYAGTLDSGYTINAVAGQSYHLGGTNSFAERDLTLVGYDSGLETDRSDYVGGISLTTPFGISVGAQGRLDEEDYDLRRTDVFTSYSSGPVQAALSYASIAAQPDLGSLDDRDQVTASASYQFRPNWTAFGSLGYDIGNEATIERSFGVGYADECFSLLVSYKETTDRYSLDTSEQTLLFRVGLRTISDFDQSVGLN
ncbi:LPS-assembly protein LptD [Aurantimonas sp. Leaf443]|uniref:LPS-assembly protein LptD n=1 Tax=Aurantimonas sp. Leaf443 TaxID=1736378 RepID=UPI0006F62A28|nr:LPS-assembly protein LptD [Aurantimonas sp. Leaf443]KQT88402.1 organic solvent tolerance protein [Aurantimonas sp. Leaf443]